MDLAATNWTEFECAVPGLFMIVALVLMCLLIKVFIKTEG